MTRSAHALQYAVDDLDDSFAVAIVTNGAPGQATPSCSGVLVSANLVITARHCFGSMQAGPRIDCAVARFENDSANDVLAADVWITTRPDASESGGWHRARRIHVPPSNDVCGADLALIVLDDRIAAWEAAPASPRLARSWDENTTAAIAHGATTGAGGDAGRRRALWAMPSRCVPAAGAGNGANGADDACSSPLLGSYFSREEVLAGDGACGGDSGSGAFAFRRSPIDGRLIEAEILGVLARTWVDETTGRCRDAVYEPLYRWATFLQEVAVAAARESGSEPPPWATTSSAAPRSISVRDNINTSDRRMKQGCVSAGAQKQDADDDVAATLLFSLSLICIAAIRSRSATRRANEDRRCARG